MIIEGEDLDSYGISQIAEAQDETALILEEIQFLGFSVLEGVLSEHELDLYNSKAEDVYKVQVDEIGEDFLESLNEKDMARCPLAYDETFLDLVFKPRVLEVASKVLGSYFILSLQNCIINRPSIKHHQSSWHRDLPYQEFTTSYPLGLNAFYCLCDFNEETGGTLVLPHSHRMDKFPSLQIVEENTVQVTAKAGSVILFDPMVYHKAGFNRSEIVRRGINHLFTRAFVKQQINLSQFLSGKDGGFTKQQKQILGYDCQVYNSVVDYRRSRIKK